ncbi:MAG TPA: methyl-accepting chemotaxis protein [Humidesulfovibrio sp.]|uniref:methyl-accepting chemotaxis protein n=1 Tax=Humidesulfovibrio sp. TaxID=2910988 RepID=UPI002B690342|nr:methyl-accepting chemotaxis protein [Humidesulfovibrio sp.]HWR03283.1 methyl-accepting chemotaxis protein [Humidesulfovibrio sp.]
MFAAMKLSRKLSLGFGVMILLLLALGAVALSSLGSLNANVHGLADNWLPSVREAAKLDRFGQGVRRQQLLYLTQTSASDREKSAKAINERLDQLEKTKAAYSPLISSPEEQAAYDEFSKQWAIYQEKSLQILALAEKGKHEDALALSGGDARTAFNAAMDASQKIIEINNKGSIDEGLAANATYKRGLMLTAVILALAAALGVAVAALLIRSVMSQLGEDPGYLAEVAGKIAGGDLNVAFRPQKTQGGVYHVLQGMVATMKAKIAEAEQKSTEAAEQARLAGIATDEANEAKAKAERAKAEGMIAAATQLEKVVEVISSASEELSAQVEQSSRGSEVQSARVAETATAMEEMNSTVLEVARNASQAAESTDNARKKAGEGSQVVSQVVSGIGTMQQVSVNLKEDMGVLGRQAEGIGQIMNVISDIADQTNLLALNAAIEAARAGDAGRGFAVVADEVRKLAEKTMNATREVGEAIRGIQDGARKNMDNVDRAVHTVEEATKLANRSGEALHEIVSLVDTATDQVRSIATASEQQSATSEEINRSIEDINRISSETADAMRQSAQAVGELANQTQTLRRLIEDMKRGG